MGKHDQGTSATGTARARLDLAALTLDGSLNCLLGLAAVRVWLQCVLFGGYISSDDGLFTIINNFGYGAAILTGALLAMRAHPGERTLQRLGWTSFALKTLTPLVLLALPAEALRGAPLIATGLLAGVAGALGAGVWTSVYARLDIRRAVFYGFSSLGLGSIVALLVSFMTPDTAHVTSILMAALAQLCYRRALVATTQNAATFGPTPEPVYDSEPRSTALIILGGLAVFGFALGISRGYPAGEPVPMSATLRAVHQLGVALLAALMVWRTVARGQNLSFSLLWRIEIVVMAAGMFTLSAFPGHFTGLAIALVNIADSFMLGVLWVTMQDVSRHCSAHAYSVFGVAWAVRVFSREAGRVLIAMLGPLAAAPQTEVVIGTVTAAVAASMAILLSENLPRMRPLFAAEESRRVTHPASAERPGPGGAAWASGPKTVTEARAATQRAGNAAAHGASRTQTETRPAAAPIELDGTEAVALSAAEARSLQVLRKRFGLSEREAQVAVLIAQGRSKAAIARHLFVSENTVRTHAKNAYSKLGVCSKTELAELLTGLSAEGWESARRTN